MESALNITTSQVECLFCCLGTIHSVGAFLEVYCMFFK